ncbi:MAG: hypothetical protein EBX94_02960 [Burkholderiaceae bacterium]|nr:hypothetical protein [Burkholderiaceae bacterium]
MFGLRKTLSSLFTRHRVDEAWFDHLEELLIKADVGVSTSTFLITSLRKPNIVDTIQKSHLN